MFDTALTANDLVFLAKGAGMTLIVTGISVLFGTLLGILFGVFRYLYLVHQRQQGGSPTEIVLTDRGMQVIIGLYLALVVGCLYFGLDLGLVTRSTN